MPDVFITLEEAAAFEGIKYKTLVAKRMQAESSNSIERKSQAREGGGKDQDVDLDKLPLGKGAEGMASRAEGGRE